MGIRLRAANPAFRLDTEPVRTTLVERFGPLWVMVITILMSQALEAFADRQMGGGVMGKFTIIFAFVSVMISILPVLFLRLRSFLYTIWVNLPFQIYTTICVISVLWSIAPGESVKAAVTLICFHGTGLAMATLFSWRSICMGIAWAVLFLAIASVAIIPMDGLETELHVGALRGLWMEKNAASESFAIGAIACAIIAIADRNPKYFLGMFFLLGCLVFAKSAGGLLTCLVALSFFFFAEAIRRGPARFFLGGWTALTVVAIAALLIAGLGVEAAELIGRDTKLTGRTEIWPTVIRFIEARPMLGYGFEAFWLDGSETKNTVAVFADFIAHNAHNSYFEIMLSVGLLGSVVIWFSVARSLFQSSTALFGGRDARRFALPFMIFVLILSFSESTLGDCAGMGAFILGLLIPKVALSHAMARGHYNP